MSKKKNRVKNPPLTGLAPAPRFKFEAYEAKLERWAKNPAPPMPSTTPPGPYNGHRALQQQYRAMKAGLATIGLEALGLQYDGRFSAHCNVRYPDGQVSAVYFSTPDIRHAEFEAAMKAAREREFRRVYGGSSSTAKYDTFGRTPRPVGQRFVAPPADDLADTIILDEYDIMTEEEWEAANTRLSSALKDWPPEEVEALLKDLKD